MYQKIQEKSANNFGLLFKFSRTSKSKSHSFPERNLSGFRRRSESLIPMFGWIRRILGRRAKHPDRRRSGVLGGRIAGDDVGQDVSTASSGEKTLQDTWMATSRSASGSDKSFPSTSDITLCAGSPTSIEPGLDTTSQSLRGQTLYDPESIYEGSTACAPTSSEFSLEKQSGENHQEKESTTQMKPEHDPILEEADRAYRGLVEARRLRSAVLRLQDPYSNISVVDKYRCPDPPEIIRIDTPPAMNQRRQIHRTSVSKGILSKKYSGF